MRAEVIRRKKRGGGFVRKVPISTEYIRLDGFLKFTGAASTGGEAKLRIENGEVRVNGDVCVTRGKKLRPGDRVTVGGEAFEVTGGDVL